MSPQTLTFTIKQPRDMRVVPVFESIDQSKAGVTVKGYLNVYYQDSSKKFPQSPEEMLKFLPALMPSN